ncbi:bacteriodes thetaiotaomicron symbiotic chitinase [Penicillium verhagenii]|uniref:bacteriodes thetaiotaomicron symbiotic chitinase n=1 Tax=Penicillium verhagenii TaxID=1562060 RepID=UPI002544E6E5|nr:bacteriodes thetaiotaomicron symbiotic chitinase [Penicillium verhagenii]KAJ5934400.1 bacteriodes thetaiotaomicron symbiotic chitinase [Penicillium verhagenii]
MLGMGFYGCLFTLSDYSYTDPGCLFLGPGDVGACSDSSSILSYKVCLGGAMIWAINQDTYD